MINAESARAMGTPEARIKYHVEAIERRIFDVARARTNVSYLFSANTDSATIDAVAYLFRSRDFVVTANEIEIEGRGGNWVQHIEIRIDWEGQ